MKPIKELVAIRVREEGKPDLIDRILDKLNELVNRVNEITKTPGEIAWEREVAGREEMVAWKTKYEWDIGKKALRSPRPRYLPRGKEE